MLLKSINSFTMNTIGRQRVPVINNSVTKSIFPVVWPEFYIITSLFLFTCKISFYHSKHSVRYHCRTALLLILRVITYSNFQIFFFRDTFQFNIIHNILTLDIISITLHLSTLKSICHSVDHTINKTTQIGLQCTNFFCLCYSSV